MIIKKEVITLTTNENKAKNPIKIYYSLNTEELGEEARSESLITIYNEYQKLKELDKEEQCFKTYYFRKHEIAQEEGQNYNTDYVTEGKIYRRGEKVFFKAL